MLNFATSKASTATQMPMPNTNACFLNTDKLQDNRSVHKKLYHLSIYRALENVATSPETRWE